MMRFLLAFAATLVLAGVAHAAPTKLWEVTGLDTPESVVFDPASNALYVSSIGGEIMAKDRNGFISKISPDGKMIERDWLTGLNGPAGLALSDGKLYAGDIDELVEIDVASAKVLNRYKADGAKFLNGVTSDKTGAVYAADTLTDTIWRLKDGRFEPWLQSKDLNGPNGLVVDGDQLIVASFGKMPEGEGEGIDGAVLAVALDDKSIKPVSKSAIGHLDGLELVAPGHYLLTDWIKGAVYRLPPGGVAEQVMQLQQGTADLAYRSEEKLMLIPMMKDNALAAYKLD